MMIELRCLFDVKTSVWHLCTPLRMAHGERPPMYSNRCVLFLQTQPFTVSCFSIEAAGQMETTAFLSHTLPLPPLIPSRPAVFIMSPSSCLFQSDTVLAGNIIGSTCQTLLTNMYSRWAEFVCFLFLIFAFSFLDR